MAYTVGQKVMYGRSGLTAEWKVATVAKVGKTSVTLDDGSRWTHGGYRWGSSDSRSYSRFSQTLRPFDQEIVDQMQAGIERRTLVGRLDNQSWNVFNLDQLRALNRALDEACFDLLLNNYEQAIERGEKTLIDRYCRQVEAEADRLGYQNHGRLKELHTRAEAANADR